MTGRKIHGFLVAHVHQGSSLDGSFSEKITNGTWLGPNNLNKHLKSSSVPSQWLFFVHPKNFITARYKLWLDDFRQPDVPVFNCEARTIDGQ